MDITSYVAPDFLQDSDVETIHSTMRTEANSNGIDVSEGSIFWDATRPVALEKSEMIQFKLNETIKICFPQWAYGIYLDMHAQIHGIKGRKAAVKATGALRITGTPGTLIPQGFIFATPAAGGTASVEFKVKTSTLIPAGGIIDTLEIEAVQAGTIGVVDANTITLMVQPLQGIASITNPEATAGGTETEDDESLRQRIMEDGQIIPLSGSDTDYVKWAKEVPGVGIAFTIPEWNGAGTVKVIIIDANGTPANSTLVTNVQNYIAPNVKNRGGLAPIGALVTIAPPVARAINYSFSWTLEEEADPEETQNALLQALNLYYTEIGVGGLLKYQKISSQISNTAGIADFSGLTINGGTGNIQLAGDEFPVTGTVNVS
jgi:uncharacterized phage protein gp47/JayE